jgi:ESCRT-I complex subunit TSG101
MYSSSQNYEQYQLSNPPSQISPQYMPASRNAEVPNPGQQYPEYTSHQQNQQPRVVPRPNILDEDLSLSLPSVVGAADLAPPPIPPNPEKDYLLHQISLRLLQIRQQSAQQTTSSLPQLAAQHAALTAASHRLNAELQNLQALDRMLVSNERILNESLGRAEAVMKEAEGREVPRVDDVLVAPTVVGGQLYDLVAEERAISDALFVLGKALGKERVGVDGFLKASGRGGDLSVVGGYADN